MNNVVKKLTITFGVLIGGSVAAHGQGYDPDRMRDTINRGTVTIQGAKQDSLFTRLTNDLTTQLRTDDLRVLGMLGEGSFTNVQDLLFLRGVDATLTQSDALEFYRSIGVFPDLDRDLRYILRTADEEFHLLARAGIENIRDLEGLKVNFGREGTGSFITSSVVFDQLGVSVQATSYPHNKALELLKTGELDAMAKVDGAPVRVIEEASLDDGLILLPIPADELSGTYEATRLSHDDYPTLFAPGDEIVTIAVASLLAVYNFDPNHPRAKKIDVFIDELFNKIDALRDPTSGSDPKWQEIDLADEVPGWQRHATVQRLLGSQ